ncbi:MAG: asparagine synthase (glutamine-hydrolyzing) [Candidatus Neomarinimicrobiota bacterium]
MCGFVGIWGSTDGLGDTRRIVSTLRHRGPDDRGEWSADHLWVGHCRLSVIDLSPRARQPMVTEQGTYALAFNGTIYNYKELREELLDRGITFKSESDTEVLLHTLITWGEAGLEKLRGMFAFAFYDTIKQELLLVVDRLGVKPLYFANVKDSWIFASELRAILSTDLVKPAVNQDALIEYLLTQTVAPPGTLINDVNCVPPGHLLRISPSGSELRCWWSLEGFSQQKTDISRKAAISRLRELLEESIRLRLIADVPVGAFLSGGIDSSTVVGLMSRVSTTPPRTFSVAFGEKFFDESRYSRSVASRFKTDHEEIQLTADYVLERLPEALNAFDHPSGDGVNTFMISQAVSEKGLKVALSGLGGDELFGGYPGFGRIRRLRRLKSFRPVIAPLLRTLSGKLHDLGNTPWEVIPLYHLTRQVWSPHDIRNMGFSDVDSRAESVDEVTADTMAFVSYLELTHYTHDVLLRDTDQMSMAHGLEVRVPFLDPETVKFVLALPASLKSSPRTPKKLLVEAVSDLLPQEILRRPKQGFVLPFETWMKGPLTGFCEESLKVLEGIGGFDVGAVQNIWQDFLKGGDPTWSRLWTLVALSRWAINIGAVG